jgi:ankyrin repeat protein
VDARVEDEYTPLHLAVLYDQEEAIGLLIGAGAEVNARADRQYTPLHLAALNGCEAAARLLIAAGAEVNAVAPNSVTTLTIALALCKIRITEIVHIAQCSAMPWPDRRARSS